MTDLALEVHHSRLADLKAARAKLKRDLKAVEEELFALQERIWAKMEEVGMKSVNYGDLGRFDRKATIYAQITDKDAFRQWAEDNWPSELTQLDIAAGRLNELVRARLDTEEELPPGVGFYTKQYISHTKQNKENKNDQE